MIIERTNRSADRKFLNAGLIIGVLAGFIIMSAAVLVYHESGDARFCGSCHSMKTVHARWQASNHHQFTCTECHLPDTGIAGKVAYKTRAGINDLIHEAGRGYSAGIGLSGEARRIITGNCVRCHASTIAKTLMARDGGDCLNCHRFLVHSRGQDEGGIKLEK